ncbi:MAG: non-canonical purine NTP pyrophosphatase [bacterium]
MKKVYFITSNEGKVKNAQTALSKMGIEVVQHPIDLIESRAHDPAVIALEKAEQAYAKLKKPVIVEDSGFFIRALNGFPRTYIKFSLETVGVKNIVKMLEGVKDRHCEWRMTLAYVWGKNQHKSFTFIEEGEIAAELREPKRKMMSDYWRIYIPNMVNGNEKTLCELKDGDFEELDQVYAKNNQFAQFGRWYLKNRVKK